MKLAETSKLMVTNCPIPGCNEPIPYGHPYSWCVRCGERLPETIRLQLTKLQEGRINAEAARAALGSQPEIQEICTRCGTHFMASAKLDFLGFREFACPNCHLRAITPLRWSYRITYWVFLCLLALAFAQAFTDNDGSLNPGAAGAFLLLVYLLQAILKDLNIVYHRWTHRQRPS
jgi:DNA-directed RNA polymerase subunit RPC12/RpoP